MPKETVVPAGLRPLCGKVAEYPDHIVQVERRTLSGDVFLAPDLEVGDRGTELAEIGQRRTLGILHGLRRRAQVLGTGVRLHAKHAC